MKVSDDTFAFDYKAVSIPHAYFRCVVQYEPGDREVGIGDSWYLVSATPAEGKAYDRDEFEFSYGSDELDALEQYGAELAQAAMDNAVYEAMIGSAR